MRAVQSELLRVVEERLAPDRADRNRQSWSLHVLAACEGEATLIDVLGGRGAAARQRTAFTNPVAAHDAELGAWLDSVDGLVRVVAKRVA